MPLRRDDPPLAVPDGTPLDVAKSCLQKAIRRGDDLGAAYWALQLAAKFPWLLFRRLAVIACEDVGLGDPRALPVVLAARSAYEQARKESRNPHPDAVLVVWPALYLARAAKNREADDLANAIKHLIARGWTAPVPSYAIDLHTDEGRAAIPRDERLMHWLTEASHVEHDDGPQDWRLWILRWAAQRGRIDPSAVEDRARGWDAAGRLVHGIDGYGSAPPEEPAP